MTQNLLRWQNAHLSKQTNECITVCILKFIFNNWYNPSIGKISANYTDGSISIECRIQKKHMLWWEPFKILRNIFAWKIANNRTVTQIKFQFFSLRTLFKSWILNVEYGWWVSFWKQSSCFFIVIMIRDSRERIDYMDKRLYRVIA